MYTFKRRVYVGEESMVFWFGLTSKSRDRHSNFTLFILTDGPDAPFSYAEQIKSGIPTKAEAERYAIRYAKDLYQNLLDREKEEKEREDAPDEELPSPDNLAI